MPYQTKLRKIGNSLGIVIPKEAIRAMKVQEGATLYLTEAPDCSLRINPDREHFDRMMEIAERGMQKYRNALRELALAAGAIGREAYADWLRASCAKPPAPRAKRKRKKS